MTPYSRSYCEIPLVNGPSVRVSKRVYGQLSKFVWYAMKNRMGDLYAWRPEKGADGKQRTVLMHREILGLKRGDGKKVDHENHRTLDNTDGNLRVSTTRQNAFNSIKHKNNTSGYKGVSFHKKAGKWKAEIRTEGRRIHLGLFTTAKKAYAAYCAAAKKYHGKFACI